MFDYEDELDNRAEYAEGEIMAERYRQAGREFCPDCEAEITRENPLIEELYNPEANGYCAECYDPTPA